VSTLYQPTIDGDITINDGTPQVHFDDSTAVTGANNPNASIYNECTTANDCDLVISLNSGTALQSTMIEALTTDGGDTTVYLGRSVLPGAALANTQTYVAVNEAGNIYQYSAAPYYYFQDTSDADDNYEGSIDLNCPTADDCDMSFTVESTADRWMLPLKIDTPDADTPSVQIGDPEAVLGAGNNYINVDSAGRMDGVGTGLVVATTDVFRICGEATTINNNTVYYGPDTTLVANTDGFTCDINAAGNTTEATVDELVYTNQAVQVTGMTCRNEGDANADISFTLRTAAGATVPSVTCTIADGERDCVADVQTTTAIAAGATVAIAAASTGDIADGNGFICNVQVTY